MQNPPICKQPPSGLSTQERIQTIDIIRGFALFGMLIINFTVDGPGSRAPWDGWPGFADQLAYWFISFFMDDKFAAIYCFLFGLGFAIQMQRAESRKSAFLSVYIRRLIVLYLIGAIQTILTGESSALTLYALIGVLLLFFRKLPLKFLPVLAMICFFGSWLRMAIVQKKKETIVNTTTLVSIDSILLKKYEGVYEFSPERRLIMTINSNGLRGEGRRGQEPLIALSQTEFYAERARAKFLFVSDSAGQVTKVILQQADEKTPARKIEMSIEQGQKEMIQQRAALQADEKAKNATYFRFVKNNATGFWNNLKNWSSWKIFFWGNLGYVFVLFLLGLYAGKRKIFYDISGNRSFLRKVMLRGLILGAIGVLIPEIKDAFQYIDFGKTGIKPSYRSAILELSWNLGTIIMAVGYVAALTLLLEKESRKKRLAFLAPVGRMGLTNYLLHTIPGVLIFEDFGLGLNDKIGCFYRLLLALPVYIMLIFLSRWWFKHFSIGPVEWLWRSLTYLKFQPMKLNTKNEK